MIIVREPNLPAGWSWRQDESATWSAMADDAVISWSAPAQGVVGYGAARDPSAYPEVVEAVTYRNRLQALTRQDEAAAFAAAVNRRNGIHRIPCGPDTRHSNHARCTPGCGEGHLKEPVLRAPRWVGLPPERKKPGVTQLVAAVGGLLAYAGLGVVIGLLTWLAGVWLL